MKERRTYMLNAIEIAAAAAATFDLSLKDDPTAWPEGDAVMPSQVVARCNEAATENARSALAQKLGSIYERIATEMDVAIYEDGPLADLSAVLGSSVTGLTVDLSGVEAAPDWEGRVEALRDALVEAVKRFTPPPLPVAAVEAYVASEPRLKLLNFMLERGTSVPLEESAEALGMVAEQIAHASEPVVWDDDDWGDAPGEAPEVAAPLLSQPAQATEGPDIVKLAVAAGLTDGDLANVLGISKSYYSMIRNGKRLWPGMKPSHATAMQVEIEARIAALSALSQAVTDGAVLKPAGV
jgi:hypothetical protein